MTPLQKKNLRRKSLTKRARNLDVKLTETLLLLQNNCLLQLLRMLRTLRRNPRKKRNTNLESPLAENEFKFSRITSKPTNIPLSTKIFLTLYKLDLKPSCSFNPISMILLNKNKTNKILCLPPETLPNKTKSLIKINLSPLEAKTRVLRTTAFSSFGSLNSPPYLDTAHLQTTEQEARFLSQAPVSSRTTCL